MQDYHRTDKHVAHVMDHLVPCYRCLDYTDASGKHPFCLQVKIATQVLKHCEACHIVQPVDCQIGTEFGHSDLEASRVKQVADPLHLDTSNHLVPRERRVHDREDEHEHDERSLIS